MYRTGRNIGIYTPKDIHTVDVAYLTGREGWAVYLDRHGTVVDQRHRDLGARCDPDGGEESHC